MRDCKHLFVLTFNSIKSTVSSNSFCSWSTYRKFSHELIRLLNVKGPFSTAILSASLVSVSVYTNCMENLWIACWISKTSEHSFPVSNQPSRHKDSGKRAGKEVRDVPWLFINRTSSVDNFVSFGKITDRIGWQQKINPKLYSYKETINLILFGLWTSWISFLVLERKSRWS